MEASFALVTTPLSLASSWNRSQFTVSRPSLEGQDTGERVHRSLPISPRRSKLRGLHIKSGGAPC